MTAEAGTLAPDRSRARAWRTAAWAIFAIDAVFALMLLGLPRNQPTVDLFAAAVFVAGAMLLILLSIIGTGCGVASAIVAFRDGDRRAIVTLPAFAHAALFVWFFIAAGHR